MTINCPATWTQRHYRQAVMYISRTLSYENVSEQIDWESNPMPISPVRSADGYYRAMIDETKHTIEIGGEFLGHADAVKEIVCWRLGIEKENPMTPIPAGLREAWKSDENFMARWAEVIRHRNEKESPLLPGDVVENSGVPSAALIGRQANELWQEFCSEYVQRWIATAGQQGSRIAPGPDSREFKEWLNRT